MTRSATRERSTKETRIRLSLDLDGGESSAETGVGFLDHMLDLVARHARIGLQVEASGDLETGAHHTVEDVGIVLGQALDEALGDRAGIRRYGSALIPMDEALGECAIDISGRPYCAFDAALPATSIAGFDTDLAEEFFRAVAKGLVDRLPEADADVLRRVVRASLQVPTRLEVEAETAVPRQQLEHVVEKPDACRDLGVAAIEVETQTYLRLLGLAVDFCGARHRLFLDPRLS